ncbi:hypothetical protein [Serinibacter arcticus]|nr:hypothetical protein [Serinibacter arcticus]
MSGQPDDRPWQDRPPDEPRDGLTPPPAAPPGGALVPDPTAIPSASPYAVSGPGAYGTAADDAYRAAAVVPPREHRGLSRRNAKLATSLSPFAALILFFVLMNVGGPPAWLAFLLIPITGVVTEHLRGDKGEDRDGDRRRS